MPRKGENIYKRKDGRWEARYHKSRNADGSIRYGYVYARSYTEVKNKLVRKQKEISIINPSVGSNSIRTFASTAGEWLVYKTPFLKDASVSKYSNIIHLHLIPFFQEQSVHSITYKKVEEFYNSLHMKTISVMKSILLYANTKGYTRFLPLIRFKSKISVKKLVILSSRNQEILSSYLCLNLTYRNLGLLICMYTGIRLGEACALTWEDVAIKDGFIYINKTMQRIQKEHGGKKTMVIVAEPKTESAIRTIPLPGQLLQIIKSSQLPKTGYLLTGSFEKYIEPRNYHYYFQKVLRQCGIPKTNFHTLRHTFATRCVELGFDIKTLSEILGHSNINITLNRYVHPSFDLKKQNMNKINKLIAVK